MKEHNQKLKIELYVQSRKTSCLAACALMTLHYFDPIKYPLDKTVEIEKIHKNIVFDQHELGNFAKLAELFLHEGFFVKFWLDGPHYHPSGIEPKLWKELLTDFTETLKKIQTIKSFTLVNRDFSVDELIDEFLLKHPVICETRFEDFVTHALVIRGVSDNTVFLLDPLKGYRTLLSTQLRREIDLGYMKNAIAIWR